ncbi:acetylglutamate kinase [Desulfofundulus thermocisternus]|uniref:acetylglutamate kinase n=1 Tax=Desulfofundulus thermocisternus TaxID=42471 RepID=UPI0004889A22|nr:acetylglutamate kinase [Desulfofundulus thermocisternus]MCS5695305.1 acetylglutamate kinase [Desulfofundulus thermocisternus]MDK2887771.1 acetylglutamate kinase [Thermoanaerobacter sp.]
MLSAQEKAAILVEALPYIKKFYGKTVVIKYGGHAMTDCGLKMAVLTDVVLMKYVGMHPVVVHGGGPEITAMLQKLGIESRFVSGLRVTDEETMEIVEMVLAGKLNKEIVSLINRIGGKAVGLSGKDACLLQAVKMPGKVYQPDGKVEMVDIGCVGQVKKVNPAIVQTLIHEGYIPVVAPVAVGPEGESYNVNADTVAGELAAALGADKLIILTDVEGILEDRENRDSLLSVIRADDVPDLIARGVIDGGMIPKVECCTRALYGGVNTTHILDGRVAHSILLEVFTDKGIGTMVVR